MVDLDKIGVFVMREKGQHPLDFDGETALAHIEALVAEVERQRIALRAIKRMVVGERAPRWEDDWATTNTRCRIADIADAALGARLGSRMIVVPGNKPAEG
jgi:hypothetical protein